MAVDVELRSVRSMAPLLREVAGVGAALILSHHDFRGTPRLPVLRAKVRAAISAGADIAKIATTLRSPADLAVLLQLLAVPSAVPLAVMGMGPLGRAARPLLAIAGSLLNYGYLDRPQVPGQIAAARLRAVIDELSS
jgi:3-dehydroquinate dehydratase-1